MDLTTFRNIEPYYLGLLLGIIIVIVVQLRLISRRTRESIKKQRQQETDQQAAEKAERKRQRETVIPKSKVLPSQTRGPMADPFSAPFAGNIQGVAAKWEAEIHQIGRQIIGQIDSKMAALQAITLDANRTANRLEILVEHLEQIARQQIEWQQIQMTQMESVEQVPATASSTVIPAAEPVPEAAPLTTVLKELTDDLEGMSMAIKQSTTFGEQVAPAMILRLSELQVKNLRIEAEMLANYGLNSQEIARRLNMSLGEVDLILQVQQNQ